MEFERLIDRTDEISRLNGALNRPSTQFIVMYGRRRIGKSTLLKYVISRAAHSAYFLSDTSVEMVQRSAFARVLASVVEGFDKAVYPDWESLFRSLNRQLKERTVICLDEFPYLVRSCPSLPSVIQKLLNEKVLKFDLIVCGSSQQLMHGYVLNRQAPLYGLANEIIRLKPIPAPYVATAMRCDERKAVEEYAVWGGVPRYWELRLDYQNLTEAVRKVLLDAQGPLIEEPQRLLRDDMRDTIQASTLLTIIGNGANKLSEIASRAGKDASALSEPLAKLRDLGYIDREVPYGENPKKSKRGLYHISDSLLRFHYRFIAPYRSILELGKGDVVMTEVMAQLPQFIGQCWEMLCRQYVTGGIIGGTPYNVASRWWGRIFPPEQSEGKMVEIDVVAESFDKKHLLIGECKWTHDEHVDRLYDVLAQKAAYLPFIKKGHTVHLALFLKEPPTHVPDGVYVFLPEDVMGM